MYFKLQVTLLCLLGARTSSAVIKREPKCYGALGCFPIDYPWSWVLRPYPAPWSPEDQKVTFYIANRDHPEKVEFKAWPKIQLNSEYRAHKPTFIITHGYFSSARVEWMRNLTDAILSQVDANVLCIDWSKGSRTDYFQAASNIRVVSALIARLIKYLVENDFNSINNFHLLGHSLGAHTMGYVGKIVSGIPRITALDPAQPGFQGYNKAVRIDRTDADFIDIIHTDGKPFLPLLGFGMANSVGTVDFFVNGGKFQPNCFTDGAEFAVKSLSDIIQITLTVIFNLATCSHSRAPRYMAAAIKEPCRMWGYRYNATYASSRYTKFLISEDCSKDTCTQMGLDTPVYPARGNFALETTGIYPFCIDDKNADEVMNDDDETENLIKDEIYL